jgi:hypothetical protein
MFDPLFTQFSAVQKESYQGAIGQQEHDRRTYSALYGEDAAPRPFSRRRAAGVVALRVVLALITLLSLLAILT